MKVDESLVRAIAAVARLTLTEEEVKQFTPELADVLDAFAKLSEVDTDIIEPAFHPVDVMNATRPDEPGTCLSQAEALSLTSHRKDGFFKGPKAIDK